MISSITDVPNENIDTDVCIVGAGAAGLVLGYELKDSGLGVVILESGDRTPIPSDTFYSFESEQLAISTDSRARSLGGTTTRWTGGWKPFDTEDFHTRDYIPYSGWPITRETLNPYYDRAAQIIGAPLLQTFEADNIPSTTLKTTRLRMIPQESWNFAHSLIPLIENEKNIQILVNAPTVLIKKSNSIDTSSSVNVRTLSGKSYTIRAKKIILASGGIENARLLLLSDLGNTYDQVGRYYMDHPKGMAGFIKTSPKFCLPKFYAEGHDLSGTFLTGIQLSPIEREKKQTLNSYVQLRPVYHGLAGKIGRASSFFSPRSAYTDHIEVRNFMEQEPDPKNRVRLAKTRDALGNPRATVSWSISNLAQKGLIALHKELALELPRLGYGELINSLSRAENKNSPWPITHDASHHMGTTRMGTDPESSVVNEQCALHESEDIFLAGSSVFATGGHANPTATILALAVRLAEHIKKTT